MCTAYENEIKAARASAAFSEMTSSVQPLFESFTSVVNYTMDELEFLFDCYFIHACNGLPMPCPYTAGINNNVRVMTVPMWR